MYYQPYGNAVYWHHQPPPQQYWVQQPSRNYMPMPYQHQMNMPYHHQHPMGRQQKSSPFTDIAPVHQCYVRPVDPYSPMSQQSAHTINYTPFMPQPMLSFPPSFQEVYYDYEYPHIPPNTNKLWTQHKLGEGIFGTVYLAIEQMKNGCVRRFAIKRIKNFETLPSKDFNDCKREISLLQAVKHENVIKCFTHYKDKRDLVMVLEYADAGDLKKLITKHAKEALLLYEVDIWDYFHQIASGLEALRKQGIIHRDLKPENIFLTTRNVVKIGDLGLSRMLGHTKKDLTIKVGTPYYMAPEKINSADYNYKSDVWGLGCLLYEMATHRSPFYGECKNSFALIKRIELADYPPISSYIYSDQLCIIVRHCLIPNPKKRPSFSDLVKVAQHMIKLFEKAPIRVVADDTFYS